MIIVETNKEIEDFLNRWNTEPSIIIPIWSDLDRHPMNNELSFLFVRIGNTDFILIYNHIDGKKQTLDLSISTQPKWVWDKKNILHTNLNIQNLFDISNYYFFEKNQIIPFEVQNQSFISHYTRMGVKDNLGKIVPLMKWGEYLKEFVDNISSTIPPADLSPKSWIDKFMIPILSKIEKNGIRVDKVKFLEKWKNSKKHLNEDIIYTSYNPYIITSRPSNRHGGINYGALNKSDGTREILIPRKDKIFLQFDYDAYHPRIIGKLIGYDLPQTSVHQWLANHYGTSYEDGKKRTFQILYGGVSDEDKFIPFFDKVDKFIQKLWIEVQEVGYLKTRKGRKIKLSHIESPNPQKIFNYLLQATETEFNIEVLNLLYKNELPLPILYVYDSFLFEYDVNENIELAKKLKQTLEHFNFPVKASWGTDYSKI